VEAHSELELRRAGVRVAGQLRVWRFTRIGDEKVGDAKSLARLGQLIEPRVVEQLHQGLVELALERGVRQGRKFRMDTTVVESNMVEES